ncbi:MAG TPA: hypothetical protein VNW04_15565 [Puia sp.]|nr:hypothetical protein [Puia sp.]
MRQVIYICALLAVHGALSAQTASGSWYGHADVDMAGVHNNYLTELVIKQKGNRVEGIFGYYFRDKYQSFFIHGRFDPKTREITILNIPVTFYASTSTVNSVDCNTNFRGVLINSRAGSSVKGAFYVDAKYRYTCPDIKVSYALDKSDNQTDSTISAGLANARVWKPQPDDVVVDAVAAAAPQVTTAALPQTTASLAAPAPVITAPVTGPVVPPVDPVKEDNKKLEESFAKRKPVVSRIVEVESDSLRLSFYDNGEIDGDSISVFVNHQVALSHQGLTAKAFNLFLRLDSTRDINEISMYAENLGSIPPNTALMVLTDGKNRYEVFMSSSMSENATIQVKRKKP